MNRTVLIGLIVATLGVGALVIQSFTYRADSASVDLGPIELTATEQRRVQIPQVIGYAGIGLGALLVIVGLASGRK